MENLDSLIALVAEKHQFNAEKYPSLKDASPEETLSFAFQHLALHFSKTAGKIAAVSEAVDHGAERELEELKINVAKALVNTLRLAELVGMNEEELKRRVDKILEGPVNQKK